jgi:hypothetical protein
MAVAVAQVAAVEIVYSHYLHLAAQQVLQVRETLAQEVATVLLIAQT